MGVVLYTDDATTLLAGPVLASADSLTVSSRTRFPSIVDGSGDYFFVTMLRLADLKKEIVRVYQQVGNVFYCDRAQGDLDVPLDFVVGDLCELRWCAPAARALIASIPAGPVGPTGPAGTVAPFTETLINPLTFLTASSFKMSGDKTSTFFVGRRIRCLLNPSTYVYGTVNTVAFAASETTVTLRDISANLTVQLYSVAVDASDPGRNIDAFLVEHSVITVAPVGAVLTLDLNKSQNFLVNLSASATSVVINGIPTSADRLIPFRMRVVNAGAFNITGWPAAAKFPGATAPTITSGAGKVDLLAGLAGNSIADIYRTQADSR